MRDVRRVAPILAAAFCAGAALVSHEPTRAGTTGVVNGFVYHRHDLSGPHALIPAPNVMVRLVGEDGVVYTRTDKHGFFSFVSVSPGLYNLRPYLYNPECFPQAQASADQVTSVRLIMYTMESAYIDCRFPRTIVGPD